MTKRGTGQTSAQMLAARPHAVYVWVNAYLDYPRALAKFLRREDLQIVGPTWFETYKWEGRWLTDIVLDHACWLRSAQRQGYASAQTRILEPLQPCGHPGCRSHVTHPCEGCGRTAGRWPETEAT